MKCAGQLCAALLLLTAVSSSFADDRHSEFDFFPIDHLYPIYIANPLRSTFSFQPLYFSSSDIPASSDRRFDLNMGGTLGIARLHPQDSPELGWQLSLEAGFRGQFDTEYSEDNVGWDGHYALYLDYRHHDSIAYRVGLHHTSSHVGDEYAERTGRQRINYTRQEVLVGAAWHFQPDWLTYLEVARTYDRRNTAVQRSGRAEWGVQYDKDNLFTARLGGYVALDLSTYEENDWERNTTLQAGIRWSAQERLWRLGIEYYDGRSQLGEFFQRHEKYLSLGLWLDI